MKRIFVFLLIAGWSTMFTSGQIKETRQVSGFTGINASSAFDITVVKGSEESLVIEADSEAMPFVCSEVRKGVLHLYLKNNGKVKNIKTLKASVVMKNMDYVSLSGSCKFVSNDLFTSDMFTGNLSGASHLTIHVSTGKLNVDGSGACKIRMKAKVAGNTKIDLSGASNIQGELEAADVIFNLSGSCSVDLTGSASDARIDAAGATNFKIGDFELKNATITSSGSSKITVNVSDQLKINSSGASSVQYKGSPKIQMNTSGASKINSI